MRRNAFGDPYCHSTDDMDSALAEKGREPSECYVDIEMDDDGKWMGEAKLSHSGDTVFYVEGWESRDQLRNELIEVGFANRDINFL